MSEPNASPAVPGFDGSGGLHDNLTRSAQSHPDNIAVVQPGQGAISYAELDLLTDRLRDHLRESGVRPGDRVGFYFRKSINSIASIYGILKSGAAYVPVDPGSPASRNAFIFHDCQCRVVIVASDFAKNLEVELQQLGATIPMFVVSESEHVPGIAGALDSVNRSAAHHEAHISRPEDLAYILYTSGSTGRPKGVMLTHQNATSFVNWCSATFQPVAGDRCSSHAPLHFDLSILDVHMTIKHAAALILVDEHTAQQPKEICRLIQEEGITVWYSAPSILTLLVQFGDLEEWDFSTLRLVLFAGEVFPIKHLRDLKRSVPSPVYFNLYGPTETNVCTFYRVPDEIPADRTTPMPIGKVCAHLEGIVIDESGRELASGEEGELLIRGPGVTQGYWNLPENNAKAFHEDAEGRQWYRTGDLVVEAADGNCTFLGRRDRMVKKRGYRIELGEIESCLYQHENLEEVAVVAKSDDDAGLKIYAHISSGEAGRPSIIELKGFCAKRVPRYMVPDVFIFQENLPRTSTGKVDYQKLVERC
jgi:amino acid adenylation domain-containing protein